MPGCWKKPAAPWSARKKRRPTASKISTAPNLPHTDPCWAIPSSGHRQWLNKDSAMSKKTLPEGKYVDLSKGMKIHYHDLGKGFPVLFLQGSGSGASGWSNF